MISWNIIYIVIITLFYVFLLCKLFAKYTRIPFREIVFELHRQQRRIGFQKFGQLYFCDLPFAFFRNRKHLQNSFSDLAPKLPKFVPLMEDVVPIMDQVAPHMDLENNLHNDNDGLEPTSFNISTLGLAQLKSKYGNSSPSSQLFTPLIKDYYLTDPISRASPTMAKCSAAFNSNLSNNNSI